MKSAYLTTSILANLQQTIPPTLSGRTVLSLQSITDPTGNSNREHPVSDKNLASWDEKNHSVTFCRQVLLLGRGSSTRIKLQYSSVVEERISGL